VWCQIAVELWLSFHLLALSRSCPGLERPTATSAMIEEKEDERTKEGKEGVNKEEISYEMHE
jgi:hypothetical protein